MSDENEIIEPTTNEAPEPVAESLDDTMARVAREIAEREPVHGEDGRFQPKVVAEAPEGNELPGKPEAAAPEPVKPAIEAPQSLPDEVKKAWPTLPPAVQEAWSKREREAHEKITADGQRLKSLSVFEEVLAPYSDRLKQVNAPPAEYVRRLAEADLLLTRDGAAGLRQIAQLYGIDPRAAFGQPGAQPDPSSALTSRIAELEQKLAQREKAETQANLARANQRIEELRKDRPYLDKVADLMSSFIEGGHAKTPEAAYDMAIKAHPEVSAEIAAKAKEEADKKAAEEAKVKAAKDAKLQPLGKRPGSTPTAPIKGKDIWSTMDRVGKEVVARQ